jgi:predicted secreted protein
MSQKAFGTKLQYATGPVVIGELTNIGGPSLAADTIETTTHQSADGFRTYIGGLKDGGEVPVEGKAKFSDAGQAALLASFNSGAVESMEMVFPDGSKWAFSAIVTGYEPSAPFDGDITFTATLKVSGKPAFTPAGS